MNSIPVLLEVKNICKYYLKGTEKFQVLKDISMDVFKGEFLCILGPSGCGKSTLLRQISSLEVPDSGSILMNNKKITTPDTNRILIFQDFNQLFPWKTVIDNVAFPLKINKIVSSPAERYEKASKYLEMVKLNGFDDSFPHQLSGGMKQKAAIARALAMNPEILLMDEPFGSLDALSRTSLQQMLLDVWKKSNVTIVFVTHDIHEAILLSDRITVMSKDFGQIKKTIHNTLKRPRSANDEKFYQLYQDIYSLLEI